MRTCPECGHFTRLHHDEGGRGPQWFRCWERLSHENNDFCGCMRGAPVPLAFTLYVVRSDKGLYYRPRLGSASRRELWVKDVLEARLYTDLSQARARVTYLNKHHASKHCPHIETFTVKHQGVLDETEHLKEAQEQEQRKAEEQRKATLEREEREIEALRKQAADLIREAEAKSQAIGGFVGRRHGDDCGCKSCVGM